MMERRVLGSLLVAVALTAAGCGTGPGGDEGGFGAPSRAPGEFTDLSGPSPVSGILRLSDEGCWYMDLNGTERLAVFPAGYAIDPGDAAGLVSPDGVRYGSGALVDGYASLVPRAAVPGGEDGKWGNYMSFCRPPTPELIVFESMTAGWDPSALSEAELLRVVAAAGLTEHWPCGRGWAVSSADQRVGLLIFTTGDGPTVAARQFDLPDDDWDARVVVGTNLFAQNCNDAIEPWVAEPKIAAAWPVVAGRLEITDPLPAPSDPPAPVRAVLAGGEVDGGSGRVALPPVDLRNDAFNAFAG